MHLHRPLASGAMEQCLGRNICFEYWDIRDGQLRCRHGVAVVVFPSRMLGARRLLAILVDPNRFAAGSCLLFPCFAMHSYVDTMYIWDEQAYKRNHLGSFSRQMSIKRVAYRPRGGGVCRSRGSRAAGWAEPRTMTTYRTGHRGQTGPPTSVQGSDQNPWYV